MKYRILYISLYLWSLTSLAPAQRMDRVQAQDPVAAARPWVFWYWMQASVSREGITTDLEAMKQAGIGGAYLMPIKGPASPPLMEPPVVQLSPAWWTMVRYAMDEADRLGLKLSMHASDGFALAGGPWISAEHSMQKVVWSDTVVAGGQQLNTILQQPETNEGYYRDIAIVAFPAPPGTGITTRTVIPKVRTSKPGVNAQFLVAENNKESFRSDAPCWILYTFDKPFTCRTITIRTNGNNYQAHRLLVEVSDDGRNFRTVERLTPPRHGWQDTDADVTHVIKPATARYFRFVYDKTGSEPGAEDLDAAKWKPTLKIRGLELSGAPHINQFEGKTGEVWRIGLPTTAAHVPDDACVATKDMVNITEHLDAHGRLTWKVPPGRWTILRMGHTSTGHKNDTGGGGKGLECDKFNPEAVQVQFDRWFGEAVRVAGPALAARVLKIFHVDSWECGSQNWSPVFRAEFKKRRGYDLFTYLPVMAGIPVQSASVSERFLRDVRETIAELVHDNFYGTLARLAQAQGCSFSAESVAPTMTSDGMLHYNLADIPMGEFWLRSPTHDKPNDMLDAISGAHIYGKPVVQAEAFTELRMAWDEHPGMLKTLGDRNYALGINRLVYHVFAHNPWVERKPGVTLDGVGLCFQPNQTWWKPGSAWVEYAQRCQALLQQGKPVTDVAVFTGEEVPRRAILPDRLVPALPGIFGKEIVDREANRLKNEGEPLREMPDGVTHSAMMTDLADWTDPLRGYAFDSFNKDVLLRLAKVRNGRIELPGGASYAVLVIPGAHPMAPDGNLMSPEVAMQLLQLVKDGATIVMNSIPDHAPGLKGFPGCDDHVKRISQQLLGGTFERGPDNVLVKHIGKGRVIKGPYEADSFTTLGIERDVIVHDSTGRQAAGIAWTHRSTGEQDIYFIANQHPVQRTLAVSLRTTGRAPEIYDPVSGETIQAATWRLESERTFIPLRLAANGSLFVILRKATKSKGSEQGKNWIDPEVIQSLTGAWQVSFDTAYGGPKEPVIFDTLSDWSMHTIADIRHYSGTAVYSKSFSWHADHKHSRVWLDLGHVANIAQVMVNGIPCGIAWTPPYRVEITKALRPGNNQLSIAVTNTWANRLIGDQTLPPHKRITWTTAPYRLGGKRLLEAGMLGEVRLVSY